MEPASQISGDVMELETAWMDLMKWIVLVCIKNKIFFFFFSKLLLTQFRKFLKACVACPKLVYNFEELKEN